VAANRSRQVSQNAFFPIVKRALANANQAFVGLDFDKDKVPPRGSKHHGFNGCDLHAMSFRQVDCGSDGMRHPPLAELKGKLALYRKG
jgi:hypothetical protein